jgi:hypothetical protein
MDQNSSPKPTEVFLDLVAYRAHRWRVLIIAVICVAIAFITGFSFPWGVTFLFVGIGSLLWLTAYRIQGLLAMGVLLALLWGAQLAPDFFGAPEGQQSKPVATKSTNGGPSAAIKKQDTDARCENTCNRSQAQATSPSLFDSARPLLGAVLLFVIIIGAILFMFLSSLKEGRRFITGSGGR